MRRIIVTLLLTFGFLCVYAQTISDVPADELYRCVSGDEFPYESSLNRAIQSGDNLLTGKIRMIKGAAYEKQNKRREAMREYRKAYELDNVYFGPALAQVNRIKNYMSAKQDSVQRQIDAEWEERRSNFQTVMAGIDAASALTQPTQSNNSQNNRQSWTTLSTQRGNSSSYSSNSSSSSSSSATSYKGTNSVNRTSNSVSKTTNSVVKTTGYNNKTTQASTRNCRKCNGSGKVACHWCHGKGRASCAGCDGRGYHRVTGAGSRKCSICSGKGTIQCGSCYGRGTERCTACFGKGQVKK